MEMNRQGYGMPQGGYNQQQNVQYPSVPSSTGMNNFGYQGQQQQSNFGMGGQKNFYGGGSMPKQTSQTFGQMTQQGSMGQQSQYGGGGYGQQTQPSLSFPKSTMGQFGTGSQQEKSSSFGSGGSGIMMSQGKPQMGSHYGSKPKSSQYGQSIGGSGSMSQGKSQMGGQYTQQGNAQQSQFGSQYTQQGNSEQFQKQPTKSKKKQTFMPTTVPDTKTEEPEMFDDTAEMVQQSQTMGQQKNSALDYFSPYLAKQNTHKFEVTSSRILSCQLNNEYIWCQTGSMIAFNGKVSFSKKDIFHDLKNVIKAAGEKIFKTKMNLMKCTSKGVGNVYLSGNGKKIVPIFLAKGESIVVNKDYILAFEKSVSYKVQLVKNLGQLIHSGLATIRLSGPGFAALECDFDPIVFPVHPGSELKTDFKNTIFWSGNLNPSIKSDIRVKAVFGVKSGEEWQMGWKMGKKKNTSGFVGVSPKESKTAAKKHKEKRDAQKFAKQQPVQVFPPGPQQYNPNMGGMNQQK